MEELERIDEQIKRKKQLIEEKREKLKSLNELRLEEEILTEKIRRAMEELEVSMHSRGCACGEG